MANASRFFSRQITFDVNINYLVMFTHTYLYSSIEINFKTMTFQINWTHP